MEVQMEFSISEFLGFTEEEIAEAIPEDKTVNQVLEEQIIRL